MATETTTTVSTTMTTGLEAMPTTTTKQQQLKENDYSSSSVLVSMGDQINYLCIALNIIVTLAVLTGFPSDDVYDDKWKQDGQCYPATGHGNSSNDNNNEDWIMDTSTLCCLFLCGSSILMLLQWYMNNDTLNSTLNHRLRKRAESQISHGFGHYFVHLIGGQIPRVKPFSLEPMDVGYTIVLLSFWPTILRSVMPKLSWKTAIMVGLCSIAFQAMVDIEPHLQFSYTQAVILLFQCMDLLTMSNDDKVSNPYTYVLMSVYSLPLFPFIMLETTMCSSNMMTMMGGHALYDGYLSLSGVAMAFIIPMVEPNRPTQDDQKEATEKKKN